MRMARAAELSSEWVAKHINGFNIICFCWIPPYGLLVILEQQSQLTDMGPWGITWK